MRHYRGPEDHGRRDMRNMKVEVGEEQDRVGDEDDQEAPVHEANRRGVS